MHLSRMKLDETDKALLRVLQQNAQMTAQDLGDALNLSASQAGRRKARLEECGLISGYRAQIDPERLGLGVQAFVQVSFGTHGTEQSQSFLRLLRTRREIVSAWTLTGDADYMLRVFCADLPALNALIHEVLLPHPSVARVQSQIVMAQSKADAPLPI